ncbi:unnamed protein product [Protopolystoma xenopodis]|uniref:Uncharacterized protein n=1 Tax=Protopolystoma xenopodis TaxID=117903 RepID=A0A3S5AMK2_9PLAT|nr:unnamed protein product [Protopolystoma xenopodis]
MASNLSGLQEAGLELSSLPAQQQHRLQFQRGFVTSNEVSAI